MQAQHRALLGQMLRWRYAPAGKLSVSYPGVRLANCSVVGMQIKPSVMEIAVDAILRAIIFGKPLLILLVVLLVAFSVCLGKDIGASP